MNATAIRNLFFSEGCAKLGELRGASLEEVDELENLLGVRFPQDYRDLLFAIGKGSGRVFVGGDISIHLVPEFRMSAENLLIENNEPFSLPKEAVVFMFHQGYEFCYFLSRDKVESPNIYQYVEGSGLPTVAWHSFEEFLRNAISMAKSARM